MKHLPFAPQISRSSARLEHVHTDLAGPLPISFDRHTYFLIIRDDYTHFVWIITLPSKDRVVPTLITFDNLCVMQYNRHIGCIQADNGCEFVKKTFLEYCTARRIHHLMSLLHHPQIKCATKCLIGIVKEKICIILLQAYFPDFLWP